MNILALQKAIGTPVDGKFGANSKAALLKTFTNTKAPAVTDADIKAFAARLNCTEKQIRAVASVESAGSGFDNVGRPKILFERHIFHRETSGRWSVASYSNPSPGGYSESSWDKLASACAKEPDAAFAAASWGKFQVMGMHWKTLGYDSSYQLARSTVDSERAHYELLARYIERFGLLDEMRALSSNPDDCRAFAKLYNGPAYAKNDYHSKLARAMK